MLGTPFVIAKTKDDHKKVTGFMLRTSVWGNMGKNIAKSMFTLGLRAKVKQYLEKNAVFKLDANDVVIDY